MQRAFVLTALLLAGAAMAQESASFKLSEHVFNSGGHPRDGTMPTSASFKITLDAVGEGLLGGALTSGFFSVDAGFSAAFRPPGEVTGLRFLSRQVLQWDPHPAAILYNLYRDRIISRGLVHFADCWQQNLTTTTTADNDFFPNEPGFGYFYLVTAENRLVEEGTKGFDSNGSERANLDPCP